MFRQTRSPSPPAAGFTLIELLVTVAIIAVGIGLALPWLSESLRTSTVAGLNNDLVVALNQARSEAVKRGTRVAVFSRSGSGSWDTGWEIRADAARDASFGTVILTRSEMPGDYRIRGTALDQRPERVVFNAEGELSSADPSLLNDVELRVCGPGDAVRHGRRVLVRSSGEVSSRRNRSGDTGCGGPP